MTRIRSWYLERPVIATVWILVAAVFLLGALVGAARASDQPTFCITCHEMEPYYTAWSEGPHADVSCIECHVDAGLVERVSHKYVALGELWKHVTDDPTFPLAEPAVVPNERCATCHEGVDIEIGWRSHAEHAGDRACSECHATVGHDVSEEALREAGIFNPENATARANDVVARVGQGADNLEGHVPTLCSSCHDMEATPCASCHEPTHESTSNDCTQCHASGADWLFSHPSEGTCATCHDRPEEHTQAGDDLECESCHTARGVAWTFGHPVEIDCASCHARTDDHTGTGAGQACTTCHSQAGQSWAITHPSSTANCTSCHTKPSGHRSGSCTSCHGVGTTWSFTHPSSTACQSCHTAPSGHSSGTCVQCHSTSTSAWRFTHPGSGSTCTTCHTRPSGHSSAACVSCHTTGVSWAFNHPSSSSCASCHSAPSSHYGSTCASCHSPSNSWGSATFSHPRVPGGEHSYRSFSCTSCHPSGYTTYVCTSCHGAGGGDDDDDDD